MVQIRDHHQRHSTRHIVTALLVRPAFSAAATIGVERLVAAWRKEAAP